MNMSSNKLMDKLEDYFDLSKKKQRKKKDKLLKIISKLEDKKAALKIEAARERRENSDGKASSDLCAEYKVVAKLLKKAKKHSLAE